jgi:aspartate/methionine/tyrosine aminotransferase
MIIKPAEKLNFVSEYYFSTKLQEIANLNAQGKNILNLGIGSPDLKPSENIINELNTNALLDNSHGYQSYKGADFLRKEMANFYSKIYNVSLDYNTEILPLIGSKEGIMHISMAFLNQGDKVLVPNPGYPTYTSVSNLAGATIKYYNLVEKNDWSIDFDELEKLNFQKIKIMWLNYPHMPTGATIDDQTYIRLIELAKKHHFLIVNDNPYSLILNEKPKSILSFEGAKEVALELNSLSKSHNMAGWRIGWISGASDYISTVLRFKSNMDSGMFLPMQKAAAEALKNSYQLINQNNKAYAERRELVFQIFDLLKCTYSSNQSGLFIWAKLPDNEVDSEFFVDNILYNAQVFITPGFIFGSNGKRFVRISLTSKVSVFKEAIQRIKNFLK